MNGTRLRKALKRVITNVRDERVFGTLGRLNADGTYTIRVAERPSYVYVRMEDGTLTSLPNIGKGRVQERATLPVQMMRLHNGELVLDGQDNRLLEGDTGEPDNPYGVPAHPISIHTDVDIDTPTTGQALVYDGTNWVNDTGLADVAASIEAAAAKTTPVDDDDFGITDSAASNALKKLSWANVKATLKTYFDTLYELAGAIATHAALTVTHGATGAIVGTTNAQTLTSKTLDSTNISTLTAKTTPIDADSAVIVDSAASNVFKRTTYTNVKAFLKTYFDTLYTAINTAVLLTGAQTVAGVKTFSDNVRMNNDRWLQGKTATGTDVRIIGLNASNDVYIGAIDDAGGRVILREDGVNVIIVDAGDVGFAGDVDINGVAVIGDGAIAGTANLYLTQVGASLMRINSDTSGNPETRYMLDGSSIVSIGVLRSDGTFRIVYSTTIASANGIVLNSSGHMGLRTVPQGIFHAHDGTSGWLKRTLTGVVGSEVEIIPNGTGDVVRSCIISAIARGSSGTIYKTGTFMGLDTPGAGNVEQSMAGLVITFRLYSTGQLVVYRASGSETFSITVDVMWQ
jgi:hypothetical protein